jgi:hypothetical protein
MFPGTNHPRPSRRGESGAKPMAIDGHGPRPSQGPGPSMPVVGGAPAPRRPSQAGQVYSGRDPRMMQGDARAASHHPSRHPSQGHMQGGASMPPPPQYGMRPSQMGGQGVDAGSRSSATVRAPSKPVSAMCGPSAAMEFVEPHKSSRPFSRHPSAHPDYHDSKVVVRPSSRPISDMQGYDDDQFAVGPSSRQPSAHGNPQQALVPYRQSTRRPSHGGHGQHALAQQGQGSEYQVVITQVAIRGANWQNGSGKWNNYMGGNGYQ